MRLLAPAAALLLPCVLSASSDRAAVLGKRPLNPAVVQEGLERLESSSGPFLKEEAARLRAWAAGKDDVYLVRERGRDFARDSGGGSLALAPAMAAALGRLDAYFQLMPATLARPVTPAELRAALLSEAGVKAIRRVFERTVSERIVVADMVPVPRIFEEGPGKEVSWVVCLPELGGEASLDAGLSFEVFDEPTRLVLRKLAGLFFDPEGIERLYSEHPAEMKIIDAENGRGLLRSALALLPVMEARGAPERDRWRVLHRNALTVIQNTVEEFVLDPDAQMKAVLRGRWSGRYAGFWHIHPPHFGEDGWGEGVPVAGARHGLVPSEGDVEIARANGQFLTIIFRKEGFDAYDLSTDRPEALGDFEARKVSYRSPGWLRHFESLHRRVLGEVLSRRKRT